MIPRPRHDGQSNAGQHGEHHEAHDRLPALTAALLISHGSRTGDDCTRHFSTQHPQRLHRANKGDWNACNVGNSGAGNLPYRAVVVGASSTPDACIQRNHGDWNACNVGNSGAGGLPYVVPIR